MRASLLSCSTFLVETMSSNAQTSSSSGYLFAIAATVIWSGNFIVARGAVDTISPVSLAFWRWVVACLVILPFALPALVRDWSHLKRHLPYLMVTALLGVTVFNTLIYIASHTTNALNLSLIAISSPIFMVIFAKLFLNDAISKNKVVGIATVVVGIVVLITRGHPEKLLAISLAIGDLWMLIAASCFAMYSILIKKKPAEITPWSFQLATFVLGLLMLLPFYLWGADLSVPAKWNQELLFSILYLGIFASFTSYVLWNRAIAIIGPSKAGMVYYSLPVFSGMLGSLFLNEQIKSFHLFCGVLIISGIVIANYTPKKRVEELTEN